jgi:hypothetical protein
MSWADEQFQTKKGRAEFMHNNLFTAVDFLRNPASDVWIEASPDANWEIL